MRTKLIILVLIIIVFSSCNTAKQYANYRFGGKTKQESKIIQNENKIEVDNEIVEGEKTMDTMMTKNISLDTSKQSNLVMVAHKKNKGEFNNKNKLGPIESKPNKILNLLIVVEKNPIQKIKHKKSIQKKYKSNDGDGIYIIGFILIIAGGIMALLAANVSLLDIITFGLGMIAVAIILYLIGEAFMNIFPGMSKKYKNPIKKILDKISMVKRKHKSGMKYYGGMSVKGVFWIGTGIIGIGLLFASIYSAPVWVFNILFSLFSSWLVCCLIVGAFVAIFEGISR